MVGSLEGVNQVSGGYLVSGGQEWEARDHNNNKSINKNRLERLRPAVQDNNDK